MHTAERVTLARLPSGTPVRTTVHTYGPADGPTVYAQAAQHGQEVNGTAVLRRLHDRLLDRELAGRLVAVPVADPVTFDRVSYTAPRTLDALNANMNRCWPGDPEGTLHERMAARLWESAGEADAAVDLHTSSDETLTHTVYRAGDARSRALAEAFGVDLLLAEPAGEDADEEWADRGFDGKFRVAASRAGVPTITPELAHNTQLVEPAIRAGVRGLLEVLREVGVLPGEPEPWSGTVARNHLGRVTADDAGLYRPDGAAELGREIGPGAPLGEVYDPTTYETLQEVEAEEVGTVYSVTRGATVSAGRTLVGVAMPYEDDAATEEVSW